MSAAHAPGRLARNVVATLGGRVAAILLGLVLATVFVRTLGLARYGTWSFFAALLGYATVFDFGLPVAVERAVARADAEGTPAAVAEALNAGITIAAGIALAVGAAILLLPLPAWLALGERDTVTACLRVFPVCLFVTVAATVSLAGLTGLQRAATANAVRTLAAVVTTAVLIVLVTAGVTRLDVLLVTQAAGMALASVAAWALVRRAHPVVFRPWAWHGRTAGDLLWLGTSVQVATLAAQAGDQLLRLLLGSGFGPAAMGAYDLTNRAAVALRSVTASLPVVLVPFGQARVAVAGAAGLARTHAAAARYLAAVLVPGTVAGALLAGRGLALWLGAAVADGSAVGMAQALMAMHAVLGVTAAATALGRSLGVVLPELACSVGGVAVALTAAAAMADPVARVAAFALAISAAAVVQAAWITRLLGLDWPARRAVGGLAVTGAVTGVITAAALTVAPITWMGTLAAAALAAAVAAAVTWATGLVTAREIAVVRTLGGR